MCTAAKCHRRIPWRTDWKRPCTRLRRNNCGEYVGSSGLDFICKRSFIYNGAIRIQGALISMGSCMYKRSFICKRSLIHKGSFAYKELSMWPSSSWTSNEQYLATTPRMQTPCMHPACKPHACPSIQSLNAGCHYLLAASRNHGCKPSPRSWPLTEH